MATTAGNQIGDADEFISMSDLIGWSLDLGLSFIEWDSSSRTATEIAGNRLAGNNQYWPSFCPAAGRYYMVPSDQTTCLNGSTPLLAATPIDLSAIPVRSREQQTSPNDSRRARFDFNSYATQEPIWLAYYVNFRAEYPAVWEALVDQINTSIRRGDSMSDVFDASRSLMSSFVEDQGVYVCYSESGPLIAILDSELTLLQSLADSNVSACAEYSLAGAFSAETAAALTEDQHAAFARVSSAVIDAMVSGRRTPQVRDFPDQTSWDLLWHRVLDRGIPEADVMSLADGTMEDLPDDRACRLGLEYNRALRDIPINDRPDYVADLFRAE